MNNSWVMLWLACICCFHLPLAAQLVPDGGTALVNAVTNTLAGTLTVGTNGGNTTLIITNGGRVNSVDGIIGFNTTSSQNAVYITGSGSAWSNSSLLQAGRASPGNSLVVSDGGSLFAQTARIGTAPGGSNNTIAIIGAGSFFSVDQATVGWSAPRNVLMISNAAGMKAGYIRIGSDHASATNNALQITHGGWLSVSNDQSSADVWLDSIRGANRLLISEGGRLTNSWGVIGYRDTPHGTTATVTGPGSLWHNRFGLTLGHDRLTAGGHKLVISNSAEVRVECGAFTVGSNGVANSALVTGSGSRLIIRRPAGDNYEPIVGAGGFSNELVVADGGLLDFQFVGRFQVSGSNSLVRVTGAGSLLQFPPGAGVLTLGGVSSSAHGRLILENGGRIVARNLGLNMQNEVIVSGTGSVLSLRDGAMTMNASGSRANIFEDGLLLCATLVMNSQVRFTVSDGSLLVTNAAGTGRLDIVQGTNTFDGGLITTDQLLVDSGPNGSFEFRRGTLRSRTTTISNGRPFVVGDGLDAAVFELAGGTHSFSQGIVISANATLRGCGTINGNVINHGTIIAECPGEALRFAGAVTNHGSILNSGGTLQFDGPIATVILGIRKTGPQASVTSSTIGGQNVLLEYKNLLNATSWTEILPALPATGHPMILNDSNASSSNRFYRVRAQ